MKLLNLLKRSWHLNATSHWISLNKKQPPLINKVLKSHATFFCVAGELQYLFG